MESAGARARAPNRDATIHCAQRIEALSLDDTHKTNPTGTRSSQQIPATSTKTKSTKRRRNKKLPELPRLSRAEEKERLQRAVQQHWKVDNLKEVLDKRDYRWNLYSGNRITSGMVLLISEMSPEEMTARFAAKMAKHNVKWVTKSLVRELVREVEGEKAAKAEKMELEQATHEQEARDSQSYGYGVPFKIAML